MADVEAHTPSATEQEEFQRRLAMATKIEEAVPARKMNGKDVAWSPQEGSQTEFMACSLLECLYHGTPAYFAAGCGRRRARQSIACRGARSCGGAANCVQRWRGGRLAGSGGCLPAVR